MARTPLVPKEIFFTKGVGRHQNRLQSFELALRHAGIEKGNLVRVSSIFPPTARIITKSKGLERLQAGEITYIEFLQARQTLILARGTYIDALYHYNAAIAQLEKAVGRTLSE